MSDDAGPTTSDQPAVPGPSTTPVPPPPAVPTVPVLPAPSGPATSLPRSPARAPGRREGAISGFWRDRAVPLGRTQLAAVAVVGLLGGAALVGNRAGLGVTLVGLGVLATAVPALVRRRAVADLTTLALAAALLVMVSVRAAEWVVVLCLLAAAGAAAAALTGARRPSAVLLAPLLPGGLVVPWLHRTHPRLA